MTPFERLQALARPGRIPAPPREMVGALQPGSQTAFDRLQAHAQPGRLPMQGQPQQPQFPMQGATPPQAAPQQMPQQAQEPMTGFRSPMVQQGLLGLGMGLLEASGPSTTPTSFGQALSRGMGTGVGMMQQEQQNEMQRRMFGLKEQQIEADNAESAQKAEALQAQRAAMDELMRSPGIPDAVKAMGPEAVAQYAKTHAGELAKVDKPNLQLQTIMDGGQQRQVLMDMNTGAPVRDMGSGPRWDPNRGPLSQTTINMPDAGPQFGTVQPGYMMRQTGPDTWEQMPVPGSAADREMQEDAERAEAKKVGEDRAGKTLMQDAGRALDLLSRQADLVTGAIGKMSAGIPNTPAYELQGHLNSVGSNIGLNYLQQMRENNKTGGALGQVPIEQQKRLEAIYGSLDIGQPAHVIIDNLKRIDNIYADIIYGTPQEIEGLIGQGIISREEAEPLMWRHELSFDDRGRPVDRGAPSTTEAPDDDGDLNPLLDRWDPQ